MLKSKATRRSACAFALAIAGAALPACDTASQEEAVREAAEARQPDRTAPVDLRGGGSAGEWRMAAGDYRQTRYSELNEIHAGNVAHLKVAWTFSTGINRGHEAPPLVIGNTLYYVTPFPNDVYALDLSKPGAPVRWVYKPRPVAAAQGVACCDVVNRGAAYADGRLFYATLDGNAIALDAESGDEVWRRKIANINLGETITMAPIVVKGNVLFGNSGGEFGVRGWILALDASNGREVWKAYSTGPDDEVKIGRGFRPFYEADRRPDLGVTTWPPDAWRHGGGNVWGFISYDEELDLIYHGTGNPGPWNAEMRPGDNKWTAAVFARDPDDGQARWAYQWNPHDLWDHDGINENLLLDLPIGGRQRKVLVHAERNGYVYVLDRETGQVLSATPFHHINALLGVDLETGRPTPNPAKHPHMGRVVRDICPASPGAKDWQPAAFSPRTGLVYIPHNNLCMDWESVEASYIAGTPYVGANVIFKPGPGGHRGEFTAWDPVNARAVWKLRETFPVWSGALVTAGDVVFYGTMDGWFKAVDARSGAVLWQFKLGSGTVGQPMTYRGPDGRQYVAIAAGVGGWPGAIVAAGLDPRDSMAATGWGAAMRDLPMATTPGGMLYVFSL